MSTRTTCRAVGRLGLLLGLGFLLLAQELVTDASPEDWEEINFEFNSSVLTDGFPSLLRLAELLRLNPGYRVRLEGHADYIGPEAYNERLSVARAETVKKFLVKYGARPEQVETVGFGERQPRVPIRTREGRFINRRVRITLLDAQGKVVTAGGVGEAIRALQEAAKKQEECCESLLKKLDRLDEILALLRDLRKENEQLKRDVAALQQAQAGVQKKVEELPKPTQREELARMMEETAQKAIEQTRPRRFSLLAFNAGPDTTGNLSVTAKGRFFQPFAEAHAVQAEGEYLRYFDRQEGQFDLGLVNRYRSFQAGVFSSFKRVDIKEFQAGGTLGQAGFALDYIFSRGRVGGFGTKAFLDDPVVRRTPVGVNAFDETRINVVDQIGGSVLVGLHKDAYAEGNFGALFRQGGRNRPGGTFRFVQPLNPQWAFTFEAGLNETLVGANDSGRFVFGLQFGNWLRPKEYAAVKHPVPMDIPRVRYELITRRVRTGNSPPVADAGRDQIGVLAGRIMLDGSNSYDPDGDPITFQWTQIAGPAVSLTGANEARASFTAEAGQTYAFRLVVKDDKGAEARARVTVTTAQPRRPRILSFQAVPTNINVGEVATLSWETEEAAEVEISGIGRVRPSGATTVSPTQTTTYTLTARNQFGDVSTTVTVRVTPPQAPRILRFAASPTEILPGESSTLVWEVENATEVTITGLGRVDLRGSSSVSPADTATYTLTATNPQGQVVAQAVVSVAKPVKILDFVAEPTTVRGGDPVTLRWQTENAVEVYITGVGKVPANGSLTVKPLATTTYTLMAYGRRTQATASVLVRVGGGPGNRPPVADAGPDFVTTERVVRLDGSRSYDPDGDPISFAWRFIGPRHAEIQNANTPNPVVRFLHAWGEYIFELTVTDAWGLSSTDTVRVNFVHP
ncbi:MAG: PKD domain-containing protein [Bryobacteraceae bacterium]|nr:PKD domain-containing protein [Bryobacteraceae bacterium]